MDGDEAGWASQQLALARACVDVVLSDLDRTIGDQPAVTVDWYEGSVRIATEGGFTMPSMSETEPEAALAEVADYLQGELIYRNPFAWPVCEDHDTGLHAQVRDGQAVWWCPISAHVAGRIGHLAENT